MSKAKILLFDLETTNLSANMGFVLCACYKWLGEKKVHTIRIDDSPSYDRDCTNDKYVVKEMARVIDSADLIVGHYSTKFDLPYLQTRLLFHGLPVIGPVPHVDTWRIAKYKLKMTSNRLASLLDFLGTKEKTPIKGAHWLRAMAGYKPSINYVVAHCKADIEGLEEMYVLLRKLTTTHPNVALVAGEGSDKQLCPVCASSLLQRRGFNIARTTRRQRYHCRDCGSWSSGRPEKVKGVDVR